MAALTERESLPGTGEILVVGAGPTGLVMAAELARRGVPCRVVDKAPEPSQWSKAIGIQARTLEVFENMGIAQAFVDRGHKGHGVNVYAEGRRIVHLSFDELDSPFPYLLFLPQSETERILGAYLEGFGLRVERSVSLTGMRQEADGVVAALQHPDGRMEELRVRWLIGCDGAHSTVRHLLGLPFEGETYAEQFLLADVAVSWAQSDDEFYIYIADAGLFAIFPMGQGRYRLIADNPPGEYSDPQKEPTLEEWQSLVRTRGPAEAALSDPRWMANFRVNRRLVSRLREGRVFVVGDAAHVHSPAGAQGMNTGIQDAVNLAWKLALVVQGAAAGTLLDSYQAERYPVEQGVLRGSDLITKVVSLRHPAAQSVRNHLAPVLTGLDVVQQRLRRTIAELAVSYRHSPIVEEHRCGSGPAAGDRAPDAQARAVPSGTPCRLFELLRGTGHTLLLLSGRTPSPEIYQALADVAETIRGRYGEYVTLAPIVAAEAVPDALSGNGKNLLLDPDRSLHIRYGADAACLYLIRPDGYIGFRGPLSEGGRLADYLARIITSPEALPTDR